jgi:hypothetical protein
MQRYWLLKQMVHVLTDRLQSVKGAVTVIEVGSLTKSNSELRMCYSQGKVTMEQGRQPFSGDGQLGEA